MLAKQTPLMASQDRAITYLSSAAPVSMGDWWFDIANVEHFWIRRRFEVMNRLADSKIRKAKRAAEIGCGHGLLQLYIEDNYGVPVAGFDLNTFALEKSVSLQSPLFCYDIHQRNPELRGQFDLLFLFDVLEHIDDESGFLQSVKFHLAPNGFLLVNVPASQWLYSDYDRAAGHVRRYSLRQLVDAGKQNGLEVRASAYWGLPLVPLLMLRKMMSLPKNDAKAGFDSRGPLLNRLLLWTARCEPIPQKLFGTSVMAVFENKG